jgi:zinc protease
MKRLLIWGAAVAVGLALGVALPSRAAEQGRLEIPVSNYTLPNGLKVVLSRNTTSPIVTVAVYYAIGFRVETRDRTGFAHLFEHLMFQGSENAPKGTLDDTVTSSGGHLNGSTRFDYTNYWEAIPSNALERILWLEADRMARPVITEAVLKNQQGVVGNEVKENVLNAPYGGWPWIDLPMAANVNWNNSHNFYGDLSAIEAATVPEAKAFSASYYRPGNAVLVIAGDFDESAAKAMVSKYFAPIPGGPAVAFPDISEPPQTVARRQSRVDPLAPKPGYAIGYHVPARGTPEWFAMGLLDQILVQGDDSRLYRALTRQTKITGDLAGAINDLGNMFDYRGPMLWDVYFTHDADRSDAEITTAIDEVIDDVRAKPVSEAELARAKVKILAALYNYISQPGNVGLVDLLAAYALFDNDPAAVNGLAAGFDAVTPELVLNVAQHYLRPEQRTTYLIVPGAAQGGVK